MAVVLTLIIPLGLIASDYDILALVTHGAAAMPYPFAVLLCCPATSLAALFLILERNSVTISVVTRTVLLYLLSQLLTFVIALVAYTYTERSFFGAGIGSLWRFGCPSTPLIALHRRSRDREQKRTSWQQRVGPRPR